MNNMEQLARSKAAQFTSAVTSDPRWELEDELMCQVFGFTLYGYILGIGRLVCFMDLGPIQELAAGELSGLGVGPKYAAGMMEHAHEEFMQEGNTSLHSQLVNVGHSHMASESIEKLVESVFSNTNAIRQQKG